MPMNLEYVLFSYGIWGIAFLVYVPWVALKLRRYRQGLQQLKEAQPTATSSSMKAS